MAKATYKRGELRTIEYTTGGSEDLEVDDIVYLCPATGAPGRLGIARQNIPRSTTGILAITGVWEFPKKNDDAILAGHPVNYNPALSGGQIVVQHASAPTNGISRFGVAMANAPNPSTKVEVDISDPGIGNVT